MPLNALLHQGWGLLLAPQGPALRAARLGLNPARKHALTTCDFERESDRARLRAGFRPRWQQKTREGRHCLNHSPGTREDAALGRGSNFGASGVQTRAVRPPAFIRVSTIASTCTASRADLSLQRVRSIMPHECRCMQLVGGGISA